MIEISDIESIVMDKIQNLDLDLNLSHTPQVEVMESKFTKTSWIRIYIYTSPENKCSEIFRELDLVFRDILQYIPDLKLDESSEVWFFSKESHPGNIIGGGSSNIRGFNHQDIIKDIITKTHGGDTRKNFDDHYWIESVQLALSFNRGKND